MLGASGPLWFSNIWLARATIVIANLWLALPFDILVLLAGLRQSAAGAFGSRDGGRSLAPANPDAVTLPLLRPVIAVICDHCDAFRIFDVVYV